MWQAQHVCARLAGLYPRCSIEILGMSTRGDRILDRPLAKVGGKGLFIKELETALLERRADLAVHSMKDVPMQLAPEFALVAICERETPLDAFVSNSFASLENMPAGSVVGTSSLRREAQIHARFPRLVVTSLRGNLDTRLRKLDACDYDAIILAAAGLVRLGLEQRIRAVLPPEVSLPAAGQGALGVETLASRDDLAELLAPLNHEATDVCVRAERALSRSLAGSCEVPLGAFAELHDSAIRLRAFVASPDGANFVCAELTDSASQPERLGMALADRLRAQGADSILAALADR
jgi:hydroxymethylbilane synthase